jgi:hypothetical protein
MTEITISEYGFIACDNLRYNNSNEIFEKVADNTKILDEEKYNTFKKETKC